MAVNVVRGLCCGFYVSTVYFGIRDGIFAADLSNKDEIIPPNPEGTEGYHEYANRMAITVGVNKKITVTNSGYFLHSGSNLFSFGAGIAVDLDAPPNVVKHMIVHELIHIKCNDILTWAFVPVVISIFATLMLNSKSPMYAPLAGLSMGVITFAILRRWTEKRTFLAGIKLDSIENNLAVLDWLQQNCSNDFSSFREQCFFYILKLFHPSNFEIVRYYQDQLNLKV